MEAVLTLAVRWELEQVVDACCSFLGDHLRPSNCLTVLRLAADNHCSGLKSIARFYIAVVTGAYRCKNIFNVFLFGSKLGFSRILETL